MMSHEEFYKKWSDFITDPKYFLSDEESWELKLEKLKKYIDENAKSTI